MDVVWVTGSTQYTDRERIAQALAQYPAGTVLFTGQARGADTIADELAQARGFFVVRVPYAGHLGRSGGPARNGVIARTAQALASTYGRNAHCHAFGSDRGTDGSVEIARRAGFLIQEWDRS
jgi:hypothetical protein